MDIAHQLSHELLRQDFVREQMAPDELDRYKMIACHYARVENALSVLSDMRSNTKHQLYLLWRFLEDAWPNKSGQDRRGLLHLGRRDPEIGAS